MAVGTAIAAFGTKDASPLESVEEELWVKRDDPDLSAPVVR